MKLIVWPFRAGSSLPAISAVFLLLLAGAVAPSAAASTRPQTGGTLRVQMRERLSTIDPRQWPSGAAEAAAAERTDSLVFDRLARLDAHGIPQPALAISWQHDALFRRWQFRLRGGVKFSDGAPLAASDVAMALQQLLGAAFDVSADSDSVVIQSERPLSDLPEELATGRYFVFRVGEDDSVKGTGPFRVAVWPGTAEPAKAVFAASDTCWAGRPFVDRIELMMGVEFQQQANAISFGQADIVELSASEVRRAAQRGIRTVSSDPVELFALAFDISRPAVADARLRQALSLSIDRASIADVILQRQGVPAGGLLPNWISGYAHLFPVAVDVPRAKSLVVASGREFSRSMPLVLIYDSGDAEARAVADRVAVNLREAGIIVKVSEQMTAAAGKMKPAAADMRLVRHRFVAPDPAAALSELLSSLGETATEMETPEKIYAAERSPIDAFRVIPLVHVSESYGLGPQVRDWMAPRWGGWRLADVWLATPPAAGENSR